jgi:hypothetical protein
MKEKISYRIPIAHSGGVRSLHWHGDALVDLASGGITYHFDGTTKPRSVYYAYRFDQAIGFKETGYAILYEKLGTKGLILKNGKHVREINRSYYRANAYEYPIAIFELPDGRVAIAHCPEEYNKIEIEEIESGKRLAVRQGEAQDFFHSRLQVSPNGEYLISAGWVWHPIDLIQIFSIPEALRNPSYLDQYKRLQLPEELFEINAAAFQKNGKILITGLSDGDSGKQDSFLVRYNPKDWNTELLVPLHEVSGTIMAVGDEHLVGFSEHPKLIEISTGKVIYRWPELKSGNQNSSIIHHLGKLPYLALDPARNRFAVADDKEITVIELE